MSSVFDPRWYRFHPFTCLLMISVAAVLVWLNTQRSLYFLNGTSPLWFGHGWPIHYQGAPMPGPGQLHANPNGILPNYIWGQGEFNNDSKIMARYESELGNLPRSPWGLRALAKLNRIGLIIDLLVGFFLLYGIQLLCEAKLREASWETKSGYFTLMCLLLLVLSTVLSLRIHDHAFAYIMPITGVVLASMIATAITLRKGFQ